MRQITIQRLPEKRQYWYHFSWRLYSGPFNVFTKIASLIAPSCVLLFIFEVNDFGFKSGRTLCLSRYQRCANTFDGACAAVFYSYSWKTLRLRERSPEWLLRFWDPHVCVLSTVFVRSQCKWWRRVGGDVTHAIARCKSWIAPCQERSGCSCTGLLFFRSLTNLIFKWPKKFNEQGHNAFTVIEKMSANAKMTGAFNYFGQMTEVSQRKVKPRIGLIGLTQPGQEDSTMRQSWLD